MSEYVIRAVPQSDWPPLLAEIPQPPKQLWVAGTLPRRDQKLLAVVGSRNYSSYGKQVVDYLMGGLAGTDIGIVSGLAIGIDALAHEAALRHQLYTLAVPGSGLDTNVLYPASNRRLAHCIIAAGGGLLSELAPETKAAQWTFPQRNRLMAGMSHATLLIEASEKSGTLITARLATDYNRELLAVPGSIFSHNSLGTHQFIKLGATPVTCSEDILNVLGITKKPHSTDLGPVTLNAIERQIIHALHEPTDKDSLIRTINLSTTEANIILMQMELNGYLSQENNIYVRRIKLV
jgi:DNA processing protein